MAIPKLYAYNAGSITCNPVPEDTYFYTHPDNPSDEQWVEDCENAIAEANAGEFNDAIVAIAAKGYVFIDLKVAWFEPSDDRDAGNFSD